MTKIHTYPLKLTTEELETLRRRAAAVPPEGISIQKYAKRMLLEGKLPKRTK